MYVRSFTWGQANLSWSVVMEELLAAVEKRGNFVSLLSTNGYENMMYWDAQKSLQRDIQGRALLGDRPFDLDITYTVPENFPQRFLSNSRIKAGRFDYESSIMPVRWHSYYSIVDYVLPSTRYVADMFLNNGCPAEKIKIIPHGVDGNKFSIEGSKLALPTEKKFRFLCVGEPHFRKQIDKLLRVYCQTFTSADDVTLVLKTKIFDDVSVKDKKGFEQDLRPILLDLKRKHGPAMPEIKIVNRRISDMSHLYRSADAFVLMSASEGWGMPYLESLACGTPVIAPAFGGQLDFLNTKNSILTKCGVRKAIPQEQYWQNGAVTDATVGDPDERAYSDAMRDMVKNGKTIKARLLPGMIETAKKFSWDAAAAKLCELVK